MDLENTTIAIIGLGLMGGSLALALKGHCSALFGIDNDPTILELAKQSNLFDHISDQPAELLSEADIVILAVPVRSILTLLDKLPDLIVETKKPEKIIVLDIGSTKTQIVHGMQSLPPRFDPIGGHPMCGKESSGFAQADRSLFRDKMFILTPLDRTSPGTIEVVKQILAVIGATPILLSAQNHDNLVSRISHLPYLTACALVKTGLSRNDPTLWKLASSGFRDASRLAEGDSSMWLDILMTNQDLLEAMRDFQKELSAIMDMIELRDELGLIKILNPAREQRARMYK